MKAAVLQGLRQIKVEEIPTPTARGNAIIKVEAVGLCGSDLGIWANSDRPGMVLGHEFAGTVIDPGDRKDLKLGDRVSSLSTAPCGKCRQCLSGNQVYCNNTGRPLGTFTKENIGVFAEYFEAYDNEFIRKLPDGISLTAASMTEPSSVTLHSVQRGEIKLGDKILVTGGGFIGGLIAQWAKKYGAAYVALSEPNKNRGDKLKSIGYVDEVFDPTEEGAQEKIMLASGGATIKENGGFDVCFECSGHQSAITMGVDTCKKGARMVLVGIAHEPISFELLNVQVKNLKLVGIMGYTPWMFGDAMNAIANGTFPVMQYLTKQITLDGIQTAFENLREPTNADFKVVAYPHGVPKEMI